MLVALGQAQFVGNLKANWKCLCNNFRSPSRERTPGNT